MYKLIVLQKRFSLVLRWLGILSGQPGRLMVLKPFGNVLKYSEGHHSDTNTDDTKLLNFNDCVKSINKQS